MLHSYASVLSGAGDPKTAIEAVTEQVAIRRRLGDPMRLAGALTNLGNYLVDVGRIEAARPVLDEAAELYVELGDSATLALVGCTLGYGEMVEGRYGDAEASFRDALGHARSADHAMSIAVTMSNLGQALTYAGRGADARPHLVESHERFVELSVQPGVITNDTMLGLVARSAGDPATAARHWLSALDGPGQSWFEQDDYSILQYAASIIDDLPTAATLVGAASAAYEKSLVRQIAYVLDDLATTRSRLEAQLGPDEFGPRFRAGERRTKAEAIAIGIAALEAFLETADPSSESIDSAHAR